MLAGINRGAMLQNKGKLEDSGFRYRMALSKSPSPPMSPSPPREVTCLEEAQELVENIVEELKVREGWFK